MCVSVENSAPYGRISFLCDHLDRTQLLRTQKPIFIQEENKTKPHRLPIGRIEFIRTHSNSK